MTTLLPSLWGKSENTDAPYHSLRSEIDKVFEDFHRGFGLPALGRATRLGPALVSPNINVAETDKVIEVTAELPGVAEEDIDVTLRDHVLTIRGEKKDERTEGDGEYRHVERSFGSFQRAMRLPFDADAENVRAEFKDGVLKVIVAKPAEMETRSHRVAIKSG